MSFCLRTKSWYISVDFWTPFIEIEIVGNGINDDQWYPPSSNICIIYQTNRNMTAIWALVFQHLVSWNRLLFLLQPDTPETTPLLLALRHLPSPGMKPRSVPTLGDEWSNILGCLMRSSLCDTNPNNAPWWGNPSNLPCILHGLISQNDEFNDPFFMVFQKSSAPSNRKISRTFHPFYKESH